MPSAEIAVIGDYRAGHPPHAAIAHSVAHADAALAARTSVRWIATPDAEKLTEAELAEFGGFWIAPGSPYRSIDGALRVIEYARRGDRPLLGTCGGFQHLVLELARNVLGAEDAAHAEYDPYASRLFVSALSCSLAGLNMGVRFAAGTMAAGLYGTSSSIEKYYCDFGLNPEHLSELLSTGVVVSGVDTDGEPRIIELSELRFFLGTLFVPQTSSTMERPHPLVRGFVRAINLPASIRDDLPSG